MHARFHVDHVPQRHLLVRRTRRADHAHLLCLLQSRKDRKDFIQRDGGQDYSAKTVDPIVFHGANHGRDVSLHTSCERFSLFPSGAM